MAAAASTRERYTMPPQRKTLRFIGRAGMELVHAPLNLRGRDNHSPRPSGNPMPAKKFMRRSVRTSQGISAIMAARRGASLRVRIEQGTNSGKRPAQYQLATNRCGVRRRWLRGFRIYAVE